MNGKLLSQLPDFLCENELVERLKILPNYNINIANETMPIRLLALSELYDIYIPSQLSVDVYNKLYMALLRSIKKKENDMMVKQQRIENTTNTIQTYNGIIGGADSFTIIGVSGIGKSSAITRAISLIFGNHFIETTDPYQRIAPFILVQCPFDSSVKSLLLEIVRILDATLDGDYLQIAQRYTTDRLIGFVSQICLNHVGVLIVDEIQNVVNNKNGDKLIGALTQIINSRVSELESMNICDVNFDSGEVIVRNGKGKKERKTYLTEKAKDLLVEYLNSRKDNNEALFVSMRNPYNRLLKPAIEYLIKAISKKAGLTRHVFPHLFRNTLATNMLKHGGDITSIQTILGHSNIQTTLIYARQDDRKVKKDHARCIA